MIYICACDDIFLREEQVDKFLRGHPRPRKFFLGDESQHSAILAEISTLSLFAEQKSILLLCTQLPLGQDAENCLIEVANKARDDEDIMLVISLPRLPPAQRQKKWFKELTAAGKGKKGEYIALYPPEGKKLTNWLNERAQKLGVNLDAEAVEFLAQNCEGNLAAAVQELEKLRIAYGEEYINYEQLNSSIGDNSYYDIFSLTDAILSKDIPRCRRILAQLQMLNSAPTQVIWLLKRDIDMLLALAANPRMNSQELFKYSCFGPRQSLARGAASRFGGQERGKLLLLLRLLASADRAAKGGSNDDCWQIIEAVVLRLSGLASPAAIAYLKYPFRIAV